MELTEHADEKKKDALIESIALELSFNYLQFAILPESLYMNSEFALYTACKYLSNQMYSSNLDKLPLLSKADLVETYKTYAYIERVKRILEKRGNQMDYLKNGHLASTSDLVVRSIWHCVISISGRTPVDLLAGTYKSEKMLSRAKIDSIFQLLDKN